MVMMNNRTNIDNLSKDIITKKRLLTRSQKAKLKLFLYKLLCVFLKMFIAYKIIDRYSSHGILLILGVGLLTCILLANDVYFLYNAKKLFNLFAEPKETLRRRIVFDRMRRIDVFMDFLCMYGLLLLNYSYTITNLLIVICLTIILHNEILSEGLRSLIDRLEKLLFPHRVIVENPDKPRGYFWDRIFPQGRPIGYFRFLSIEYIILLSVYTFFVFYEADYLPMVWGTPILVPCIIQYIIYAMNIWIDLLYITRIWSINIYKDTPSEIEAKKNTLLLMERFVWFFSIITYPIFAVSTKYFYNYIYYGEISFLQALIDIKDELPDHILTWIVGDIFYLFNLRSIKILHSDVKTHYNLITFNIFKSWQKVTV